MLRLLNLNRLIEDAWQYEKDVISGKIPSGKLLKLAVKRNIRDRKNSKKKNYPYYFDEDEAIRVIKFCELCNHWKGAKAKTPILLEPNQKWRFAIKYGWKSKDTGHRRFRKFYEEVARKNAKTTEKALEAIYHMIFDGGHGSQVVAAATKADQARLVVNDAGKIIESTPSLKSMGFRLFKQKEYVYNIYYKPTESSMFAIGRDSDNQDGLDPSFGIIDEYHAHKTDDILNVVKSGMQARPQPMLSIITTAGFDKEGPCYRVERKNAIDILENTKQDETYFVSIYTPDKEDEDRLRMLDPNDIKKDGSEIKNILFKSNPNLGSSVIFKNLIAELVDAINKGGSSMVNFLTKNANTWVDAADTWIETEIWYQNTIYNEKKMWPSDLDLWGKSDFLKSNRIVKFETVEEILRGRRCWGGLDLSSSRDFTAYVLLFEPDEQGRMAVLPYIWTTEAMLKKLDQRIYYDWVNNGYLRLCAGELINHQEVWDVIKETSDVENGKFEVMNVAYDPAYANHSVVQNCINDGFEWMMSSFGQFITNVSYPTKFFEETCYSIGSHNKIQGFEHFNNPVLKWMLSNVEIYRDNNANIRVIKKDPKRKVDGIAASINACASYLAYQENQGASIRFIEEAVS